MAACHRCTLRVGTTGVRINLMKYLMSSPDPARIALVQSLLDAEGIQWEVRNELVSQAEVGLPFATELWVFRDEDLESASTLLTGR
jgi:hypothetical protein